jgi:hypothetical protein
MGRKDRLQLTVGGGITGRGGGGHFGYGKKKKIKDEEEGMLMSCSRAWAGVLASAVWVVSTTELVGVHAKGGGKIFGFVEGCSQTRRGWRWRRRANAGEWGRGRSGFYFFEKSAEKIIWISV